METLVTVVHIIACALIILVVLLQSGKGAEISASFGGSSQTVFGSSGGANFFTRLTSILAGIFMATSIGLTVASAAKKKSVTDSLTTTTETSQPAAPAPAAPANAPAQSTDSAPQK